jgi:hypothetical protein
MDSGAFPGTPVRDTTAARGADGMPEAALHQALVADPNDENAFDRLVCVLARAKEANRHPNPRGESTIRDVTWSLAAELAQRPEAWFPLLELARLSLEEDLPAAVPRLRAAVTREPTGRALTRAATLLRTAGHPNEAFRLAVAHWRPASHELAAGRQLVLAGLEAGRVDELRRHLRALATRRGGRAQVLRVELALRDLVAGKPPGGTEAGPGRTGRAWPRLGRRANRSASATSQQPR